MIKIFVLIGIIGASAVAYLTTFAVGPEFQLPPAVSLLKKFEADNVVPGPNDVTENEEVEHGVFEVPEEDERQFEKAAEMFSKSMPGMNMGGGAVPGMKMDGDGATKQAGGAMPGMKMDGDGAMKQAGDGTMAGMKMAGKEADEEAEGGLKISAEGAYDREINLKMAEWRFSEMNIQVKQGERIRFTITNEGKIPHEFMFMTMPAMAAINYRAKRADWSLLEHEALFEKALVLPDGKFSFVAEIAENGSWMFMCMLPYHMQMGMMGQMATPGMAMDMAM